MLTQLISVFKGVFAVALSLVVRPQIKFIADHSFTFIIRNENELLFMGRFER